jgi:hypothetical protein
MGKLMKRVKLTVEQHRNGSLSLWIEHEDLGPQGRHRGGYELAENMDHARFYRVVARGIAEYAAEGLQVDYKDIS